MNVIDALKKPWAIRPGTLETMFEIYERHLSGEGFDRNAVEAAIGKPLNNRAAPYQVLDSVAVLDVHGVIAKRMNMFVEISGGSSTQRLQGELAAALADPAVRAIILNIDSPGGEVDGTQALANDVFRAREKKPIVALGDGVMASAAYWIGAAADRVYITSGTTLVGSIGIVAKHTDISRAQEARGVKTTEIAAGKYKTLASEFAPLTAEGKQSIQDMLDAIYSVFVNDIAEYRDTDTKTVLKDMADGRIFVGQAAIEAGLADGISSLTALIAQLSGQTANVQPNSSPVKGGNTMIARSTANSHDSRNHNQEPPFAEIAEAAKELIAKQNALGRDMTTEAAVRQVRAERGLPANPAPIAPTATQEDGDPYERRISAHSKKVAERAQEIIAQKKSLGIDMDLLKACEQARAELGTTPE